MADGFAGTARPRRNPARLGEVLLLSCSLAVGLALSNWWKVPGGQTFVALALLFAIWVGFSSNWSP